MAKIIYEITSESSEPGAGDDTIDVIPVGKNTYLIFRSQDMRTQIKICLNDDEVEILRNKL